MPYYHPLLIYLREILHSKRTNIDYLEYCRVMQKDGRFNASVGSIGDSYDNAMAESINALYKAEVIHKDGPWRGLDDLEQATLTWVEWFNNRRILEPLGDMPPAEYEMLYYQNPELRKTS